MDATVDAMIPALLERNAVVHRVNTAWFPVQLSVSAELRGEQWIGQIRTPARLIELESIAAVWYRTPRAYKFPDELNPAEPKAARCGLAVPDTVITNEADTVRKFAAKGRTVSKVFGTNMLMEEGVRKIGFTRLLDEADLADLRGINVTAHLVQRWVPKAYEVRMVVIGDHITAAAIRAGSPESYIDFRSDYANLSYELIEPPTDVVDSVRNLMVDMDLLYGALDFVVQPDGSWTFLEINAGGQFGFIEDETGAPLTAQLADLLTRKKQ